MAHSTHLFDGETINIINKDDTIPRGHRQEVWIANPSAGGGGGGGAVSVDDGADVVEGALADTAITTDAAGTLSGKLRGLVKILADVWDSVNHRLKVDGSAVTQPVSGAVTANAGTNLNTYALALDSTVAKDSSLCTIDTDIKATQ